MMSLPKNKHGRWRKNASVVFILCGWLLMTAGCSTLVELEDSATKVIDKIEWPDGAVAQTFAVIPFGNEMPWVADQLHMEFLTRLTEALEERCSRVILVAPGDEHYPWELARFITPGTIPPDNIELAEICRKAGLNGVITGHLARISGETGSKGMLWFRGEKLMARVQMEIVLYHSGTAAKVMDETFFMDVVLSEEEYDALEEEKKLSATAAEYELERTAKEAARSICKRLKEVPWEGSIVSIKDGKAFISFGEYIGLSKGDILEVFEEGRMLETKGGSRYLVPGLKIGELKITAVSDYQSEAVLLEKSGEIKAGRIVRKKVD